MVHNISVAVFRTPFNPAQPEAPYRLPKTNILMIESFAAYLKITVRTIYPWMRQEDSCFFR